MTLDTQQLKNLLLLNRLFLGLRVSPAKMLLEGMPPEDLLGYIKKDDSFNKSSDLLELEKQFDPGKELELCLESGAAAVSILSPDYPVILKEIPDPPIVLYTKGTLEPFSKKVLAIVGSRHASFYGQNQSRRFAYDLACAGFIIVSGLAFGIDRAAHEGALRSSSGRTIGVLGCGIDIIYPERNKDLYQRIPGQGALISEFPMGSRPLAHHFPLRNRIISGLSLGVLVVEAHTKSGSLITAGCALDQGKDVFAVPGPVDQLTARGAHALIKQGAGLVESYLDILEGLALELQKPSEVPDKSGVTKEKGETPETAKDFEPALLEALLSGEASFEELMTAGALTAAELSSKLLNLELSGRVTKTPSGRYSLKRVNIQRS